MIARYKFRTKRVIHNIINQKQNKTCTLQYIYKPI
jgi:hypothetical protein